MSPAVQPLDSAGRRSATRAALASLRGWRPCLWVIAVFFVMRTPVLYLQPGGEDEDCYAVPGLTILKTGLPQLPHVPARNPESVYYQADRLLFSEPPLMFYLQSLFYLVLPDMYGTARMLSAVCGALSLAFMWWLSQQWLGPKISPTWGIALFSLSRWFYFPATRARPDMVAAVLGFAVLAAMCRWETTRKVRYVVWAGIGIGLGGLAHPFAMAYAIQAAIWLLIAGRGWSRIWLPTILTVVSIATACLWLPLILLEPEAFKVQFYNQFLAGSDGSLVHRLVFPWRSLSYHGRSMWKFLGPWQSLLAMGPLIIATLLCIRRPHQGMRKLCALSWSGLYLIAAFVGAHHPTLGYWVYPAGLMFLIAGWLIVQVARSLSSFRPEAAAPRWAMALLLLAAMLPGSGLRVLQTYVQHLGNINYNGPAFAQALMQKLPAEDVCVVDTQFALDFIVAGRKVLLAQTMPIYFQVDEYPYDHLIVSRYGLQTGIAGRLCTTEMRFSLGDKEDIHACYAEVYGQARFPCEEAKQNPLGPVGEPF